MMSHPTALNQEWIALQNNYEQYEWMGLAVKLFSVALALLGLTLQLSLLVVMVLLILVWLQEGILRTFQNRLGLRLLHVESLMRVPSGDAVPLDTVGSRGVDNLPFQLHSQWQTQRSRGLKLIREYASNALRPTVAFPHGVIVAGLLLMALL